MSASESSPSSDARRFRRDDTVHDAQFFELALATPLVFAAQPSTEIAPLPEEDLGSEPFPERFPDSGVPRRWEDGYRRELKGEADRILRSFTKTPVDSDFDEPPLPPVAPFAEENLTDRLGRGFLDPMSLTLVTEENSAPLPVASMRRSLAAGQFARMTSRIGIHSRVPSRCREERRRQELRDRVLPSSANFSPEFYLSHVHADTSLRELQEGNAFLEEELSKRTGQLKTLVKEHFEGFISCKNSIDDVHVRLKRNEAQKSGANTSSLKASLAAAQAELTNADAPILERHAKVEQLKHVAEILKRFQASFNLPSNIRHLSQCQDYQQVVSEYRRAKSTLAGAEVTIWRSLFEEVKKETTDVCVKINKLLEDPMLDPEDVQELVLCICQLRHEGLECTFTLEPVMHWLMSVEEHVHHEMDKLTSTYRWKVDLEARSHDKMKKRTVISPFDVRPTGGGEVMSGDFIAKRSTEYISQLCRLLAACLPKLWKLQGGTQMRNMNDVQEEIQLAIKKELDHVQVMVKGIMDCFAKRIVDTMEQMLMSEGLLSPCVFVILRELRLFSTEMKGCPELVLAILMDLIHECFEMCVNYLCTYLRQQMASLGEWEDWKIRIGSYCRGHPVTSVPYKLGQAVGDVMEQFRQIKAEQDQWMDKSVQLESRCLNNAFNECFESFGMAVEGLAAEILGPNEPTTAHDDPHVPETSKLLILINNSMYIRQRILPELTTQYSDFIIQGLTDLDQGDLLLQQFEKLEETLAQAYVEHAKRIVEKAVDATIAIEKESPPLKLTEFRASESAAEWIAVIAGTHAELIKYSPSKIDTVIPAMVLHLVKRMKLRIQDLPHLGFLLQVYVDSMFVEVVFKGVDVRELQKAWRAIYERLNNLISAQIRSMKEGEKGLNDPDEDSGMKVLNAFSEADLEGVVQLDKKLQRMFKEGVKESIKGMSINLASMRTYKRSDKERKTS